MIAVESAVLHREKPLRLVPGQRARSNLQGLEVATECRQVRNPTSELASNGYATVRLLVAAPTLTTYVQRFDIVNKDVKTPVLYAVLLLQEHAVTIGYP
jgi:hypothetical protein